MVHSSTLTVTADGEHMTYDGFYLGEIVRFGSLEFITDYFDCLSLSPKGNNLGTVFMGMAHSGSPSPRTILEDSTNKFYMASRREGSSDLPASQRCSMGTPLSPIATTLWSEVAWTP
jgi:hypothetical protein